MSTSPRRTVASIQASMQWMTVFQECKPTPLAPWLEIPTRSKSVTIEFPRTSTVTAEQLQALERALTGISTAYPVLTAANVQKSVTAVAEGELFKEPIGGGISISSKHNKITLHLTKEAITAITEWRGQAISQHMKAVAMDNVVYLAQLIAAGTAPGADPEVAARGELALEYLHERTKPLSSFPEELKRPATA